ncbi:hypothetical protein [Paraburkholderia unamae]|uniref:hypothetical protein n=1 Tax=Paraburkholderia unamae TaxID=219649 RepID=UPI001402B6E0|nr:hypothetical protein [Paraburkholderia unamae]CAG9261001.1 hypothetical protein PUN4_360025 [Paraburkholderia unamae]
MPAAANLEEDLLSLLPLAEGTAFFGFAEFGFAEVIEIAACLEIRPDDPHTTKVWGDHD